MANEQKQPSSSVTGSDSEVLVTPEGEVLDNSVTGTMRINTSRYRRFINSNRLVSFKYAVAGLLYVIAQEPSIRYVMGLTVATIVLGMWLNVPISL